MTMHVGVALSPRPWRGELQRHCRDHEADVVISLLRQGSDAKGVDLVIVDDDTSWLSPPFVNQTRDRGQSLIGIYDPHEADGYGRAHLARVGVSCRLPTTVGVVELVEVIRQQRPDQVLAGRFESLTTELATRRSLADRQVLAVGGPAGSGATEVSLALAQQLARTGGRPILVDVDETHPSLARRLGLGLHPHLLTAVDIVRKETSSLGSNGAVTSSLGSNGAEDASLADCLATSALGDRRLPFDVIVGLASRDDWSLTRADDVGELLTELSAQWPAVVVRLGPQLEDLSRFVDRYEVSRVAAARADQLLAVCDGSSTGLLRFVDWLVDALTLVGDKPVDAVVNRAPSAGSAQRQLVGQLREIVGSRVRRIECVGHDRRVERAAWDASLAVRGPLVSAVGALA